MSLARCQTSKNATWGQVTYCDLVTWPLGSSGRRFFRNVSNCWLNSYGKFGGATRRRFFAICEKPQGGVEINPPPPVRGIMASALHIWLGIDDNWRKRTNIRNPFLVLRRYIFEYICCRMYVEIHMHTYVTLHCMNIVIGVRTWTMGSDKN